MQDVQARALRDGIAYVDQWLAYRREFRDIPGLVVAIRHHGELLLSKAYGCANLENNVAMTTGHLFRIASHSKTFTATAIMQLVEHDRLRLDDRASATLPWLSSDITIRQLLNHTSGKSNDRFPIATSFAALPARVWCWSRTCDSSTATLATGCSDW